MRTAIVILLLLLTACGEGPESQNTAVTENTYRVQVVNPFHIVLVCFMDGRAIEQFDESFFEFETQRKSLSFICRNQLPEPGVPHDRIELHASGACDDSVINKVCEQISRRFTVVVYKNEQSVYEQSTEENYFGLGGGF